jgi:hypothetical protein
VRPSGSSSMAPAAMVVSPRSVGRAAAFSRGGSGTRRICCLPPRHSGTIHSLVWSTGVAQSCFNSLFSSAKIMLSPNELRGSVRQRRRLVPRSSTSDSQATKQEKASAPNRCFQTETITGTHHHTHRLSS